MLPVRTPCMLVHDGDAKPQHTAGPARMGALHNTHARKVFCLWAALRQARCTQCSCAAMLCHAQLGVEQRM
jgi:hypothetical protein